jgi:hypothetical protein
MTSTLNATINATATAVANSTWKPLKNWNNLDPFRIDALGLVTLLGTPEVDNHVGKLVRSRYIEFLPLLGAYVIASDQITDKQPGFQLYNIDKCIFTPDLAGWFTRWLATQDFRTASSYVEWQVESTPYSTKLDTLVAFIIGFVLNGGFLALTVLMGDWWGFSNAMSMAISTVVRAILLNRNRTWLDQAVERAIHRDARDKDPRADVLAGLKKDSKIAPPVLQDLEWHKLIVILADARAVALHIPSCLVVDCFVFNPKPPNSHDETKRSRTMPPKEPEQKAVNAPPQLRYYQAVRVIAWAAFGAHVITIGMSNLVSQIVTVLIIVLPTVLLAYGFGCDYTRVGSRLRATITDFPHKKETEEKRADMYAFLDLNDSQDNSLEQWNLAPHREGNPKWWDDYKERKALYNHKDGVATGPKLPLNEMPTLEERKNSLRDRIGAKNPPSPPVRDPNARHTAYKTA